MQGGSIGVCKLLYKYGAKLKARNFHGKTLENEIKQCKNKLIISFFQNKT